MMPKINRLTGRFFTVLISLSVAVFLPRAVVAGEATPRPPLASPAAMGIAAGLRAILLPAPLAGGSKAPSPTLCQISDTVYRADGSPAQGTVLLTWQAFTTAAGQSVTPGSLLVTLDANGGFNASVAPNTGANPAGTYYKAIFKLNDGTTETEFWVVPNTQTTTIGAIRSKLVPANQAAQFLTRDVADSNYVNLASTQSISGAKTFSSSPAVPTPQNPTDAANKAYVDANAGGNLASPPPIGATTPNAGTFTALIASAINGAINAAAGATTTPGSNDIGARVNAAFASCPTCIVEIPSGFVGSFNHAITVPHKPAQLVIKGTITYTGNQAYAIDTLLGGTLGGYYITGNGVLDGTGSTGTTGLHLNASGGSTIDITVQNFPGDCLYNQGANNVELGSTKAFSCGLNGLHNDTLLYSSTCYSANACHWGGGGQAAGNGLFGVLEEANSCSSPNTGNVYDGGVVFEYNGSGQAATTASGSYSPSASPVNLTVASSSGFLTTYKGMAVPICVDCNSSAAEMVYVSAVPDGTHVTVNRLFNSHTGSFPVAAVFGGNAFVRYATGSHFMGAYFEDQAIKPVVADIIFGDNGANCSGGPCGVYAPVLAGDSFLTESTANASVIFANTTNGQVLGGHWEGNSANALTLTSQDSFNTVVGVSCPACTNNGTVNGYKGSFMFEAVSDAFYTAGNATVLGTSWLNGAVTVNGDLTVRDIPGVEYHVSKYASIQAAINAAYNNGSVLGTVVDDRTSPYSGPGFILYDSVTLKLAATTYTITSTVTYNNGNNNVTAGIIAVPGAKLIGASTSTNHGTIITAGNGLNADLIATSTVGTGIAAAAQWWHWGGFENLRVMGNGAHQTAGNCFNIENMGETAFIRSIEVSGCYLDNILFTGASATPSDIANITTNSAGRYGFNFNNLAGVAVVHGLSGDSNATSIIRLNGGQSGTLTILGLKTEEEISGQDPLITIDQTGQNGAQPSLFIVGGYTFGRNGVNDVIKYVNGTLGTTPYISVSNFYVQNYVNAVNDVVNSRTTAATNMNKVPFYFGPTGAFFSGQAFTLDLNTFVQSPHSGNYVLTEVFGTTSSNETLVGASGTSTTLSTGGIGFRMPNRTTYGQTPELFAKMTYAFPGGVPNTQQWEFIPAKVNGDASTRWIGDPSYRWDEIYSADVNSTTATVGTLNVTTCNGCSSQQVNSDWNAGSGVAQILNKPALATVATSGSYNDLSNKPAIPSSSSWPNAASCPANQYETADANGSGPTCAQVQYSQLSGTPTTSHLIAGSMQGSSATLTGNSADQTIYTATLPAGTFAAGTGARCKVQWQHTTSGSTAITYKWTLGSASVAYASFTSASTNLVSDVEVLTPSAVSAQIINIGTAIAGNTIMVGPNTGTGSENLANSDTIKFTFNAGNGEQVKGISFYCQTVQ